MIVCLGYSFLLAVITFASAFLMALTTEYVTGATDATVVVSMMLVIESAAKAVVVTAIVALLATNFRRVAGASITKSSRGNVAGTAKVARLADR